MDLQWKEARRGDIHSFDAATEWRGPFQPVEYQVYSWKEGWAYNRREHPILGKLDGVTSTVEEAQAICEDDYAKQQRLRRWNQYMLENDPPVGER